MVNRLYMVVALVLLSSRAFCQAPIPPGLVSWWKADGVGIDSVGGQTLFGRGTAGYGAGEVNNGFKMVNSGDRYDAPDSTLWHLQQFSVDAWVNATGADAGDGFGVIATKVLKTNPHVAPYNSWYMTYSPGQGIFAAVVQPGVITGSLSEMAFTNPIFGAGVFHHVAMTYDSTTLNLYVDGLLRASKNMPGTIDYSDGLLGVGGHAYASAPIDRTLYGVIDELDIFNRVLTPDEIAAIYSAGRLGKGISQDVPEPGASTLFVASLIVGVPMLRRRLKRS